MRNFKTLKKLTHILVSLLFFLNSFLGFSQQNIDVALSFDPETELFLVKQTLWYKNTSSKPLSYLIVNDWNHAYSNRKSPLGKRFSDEYVRNFHLSRAKERGYTDIKSLEINTIQSTWKRIKHHEDLLEINLPKELLPNDSIQLYFEYTLKIPDAKFSRYGNNKGDFYLKNCLLQIARINPEGNPVRYSNENIDDASYEKIEKINLNVTLPSAYQITSNLNLIAENPLNTGKQVSFSGQNLQDVQIIIEKNKSFRNYKNENIEIETNINSSKTDDFIKAIVIDRIIRFTQEKLGPSAVKKFVISETEYDKNPFYGLNQLPNFISPFSNSFLFELKFLKTYTDNFLKQNLNIDYRKDHYILDGIQTYLLIKYVEENYPDLKLLGDLSRFKVIRGYQLAKADFNDQYYFLYLLMARKNLDQHLTESKNALVKFNEQIASRNKAGIAFLYLEQYLKNDTVTKTFSDFIALNRSQKTTQDDFQELFQRNTGNTLNWFFENVINCEQEIDFSFGKIKKTENSLQVQIHNKTNLEVPFTLSGFKNRTKVFENWYTGVKYDSIISIQNPDIDKLIINHKNKIPEINNRNNYKSLKSFPDLNKPLKFIFLKDVENPNYHQVFYVPEIGYNVYDGAILSVTFHNKTLIEKPFSFHLSPSFSTTSVSLTGFGIVNYTQQIKNANLYQVRYSLAGAYFHYIQDASYLRFTPSVQFKFRNNNDLRDNFWQSISIRQVILTKEFSPLILNDTAPLNYTVSDLRYGFGDGETAKSYNFLTNVQLSNHFGKFSIESGYRKLFENNYQLSLRLFAGTFLYKKTETDYFNFGLDRPKDYLFDYQYYGRSETSGIFSQQIIIAEGGFKSKFINPYANQWMTTLNVNSSIWKWIQLYGDIGFYKNKGINPKFIYDSGIHLNLVPDYFELFFPLYSSNGFEPSQNNYDQKIRFMVTLNPKTLINLFTRKWF